MYDHSNSTNTQNKVTPLPKSALQLQPPPPQKNSTPGIWQWWSTLTGPKSDASQTSIVLQERLRRARLISAVLILAFVTVILLIPAALGLPIIWYPALIMLIGSIAVALLNRVGQVSLSATLFVILIDAAIASLLLFKPQLTWSNLSDLDLFLLAVIVGGLILPRRYIPFAGILQIVLIIAIFQLRPHDALLSSMIVSEGGDGYTILAGTLVLQIVGTGIAWLNAWSVELALVRASNAEEMAKTRTIMEEQAHLIAEQNHHLEEGIAQILETHQQISAGNLAARAPTQQDLLLWQVGHSLNTLLRRFQQQAQEDRELRQTQQEIEQIAAALLEARNGQLLHLPYCRMPLAVRLLQSLER